MIICIHLILLRTGLSIQATSGHSPLAYCLQKWGLVVLRLATNEHRGLLRDIFWYPMNNGIIVNCSISINGVVDWSTKCHLVGQSFLHLKSIVNQATFNLTWICVKSGKQRRKNILVQSSVQGSSCKLNSTCSNLWVMEYEQVTACGGIKVKVLTLTERQVIDDAQRRERQNRYKLISERQLSCEELKTSS